METNAWNLQMKLSTQSTRTSNASALSAAVAVRVDPRLARVAISMSSGGSHGIFSKALTLSRPLKVLYFVLVIWHL
jgi:hypothetical protein